LETGKTQQDVLNDISDKLDRILGLMAIKGIENDAGLIVERLRQLGMSNKVIASIAGMTENAVKLRLSRARRKSGATKAARKTTRKSPKETAATPRAAGLQDPAVPPAVPPDSESEPTA
jgi:hypothetical protein